MKKQINNVNVEKASANAKANSLIALDVLKSIKEKNAGLFKTSLGTKTEIYKKELFEDRKSGSAGMPRHPMEAPSAPPGHASR